MRVTRVYKHGNRWYKITTREGNGPFSFARYQLAKKVGRSWQPGKWMRIPQDLALRMCGIGFHVTQVPRHWNEPSYRLWEVDVRGMVMHTAHKSLCRGMRFLREIKKGSPEGRRLLRRW